jgi:hypothetical protein
VWYTSRPPVWVEWVTLFWQVQNFCYATHFLRCRSLIHVMEGVAYMILTSVSM